MTPVRNVEYGDVLVEGLWPQTERHSTVWWCTCRRIVTTGRYVKYSMVMYLWKDCDPGQRRIEKYGDVLVEGLSPRTERYSTVWWCTCRRIVTTGRDVKYSMVMYLWKDCDPGQRRIEKYGDVLVERLRPRAETKRTVWWCTCRRIVTPGRDVTYSMVMYL